MSGDVIAIARQLFDTLVSQREDMHIALHQPTERLQQYLESMSVSTSSASTSNFGSLSAISSAHIPPDRPPTPIAHVDRMEEPESSHTLIEHSSHVSRTASEMSDHEVQIGSQIVRRPMGAVPTALWGGPESGTTPHIPRPSWEDLPEGTIVRDRNDGRGPVVEYGRPRKSRSDTSQRSRRS